MVCRKKVNLTGSVASVKGDALEHRPVVDATQSLQGLVPGLSVSNGGSGRPGATGSLSLRGQGNLSGNSAPYVLVDGVEMSLSDVNPNDIENISVLKDAAASSIYGSRAPFGVILVTTKKGKSGKPTINYNNSFRFNSPVNLPEMMDSYTFANYFNEAARNGQDNAQFSDTVMQQMLDFQAAGGTIVAVCLLMAMYGVNRQATRLLRRMPILTGFPKSTRALPSRKNIISV